MSIEKRVNKAKKGNEKAFQALIEIEKHKLYRIAYLYVKKEEDALDVVQETIYKAFISIKQLKDAAYFSTWITRILINTAINIYECFFMFIILSLDALSCYNRDKLFMWER